MRIVVLLVLTLVVMAIGSAFTAAKRRKTKVPPQVYPPPPAHYPPPAPYQQSYSQPYAQQPQFAPYAPPAAPQQYAPYPPPAPPGPPVGYQPQPQDHAVTAAGGYQLVLPQFGPADRAIISIALVAQGKVYLHATPPNSGVFGGGLDIVSGRRLPNEDVLTSVRRILAEETGWTGRPLATVGHAKWDLGSGQENEVCFAVLMDLAPNVPLPAKGITTWSAHADFPKLQDLGPRAKTACDFAGHALAAAGVPRP